MLFGESSEDRSNMLFKTFLTLNELAQQHHQTMHEKSQNSNKNSSSPHAEESKGGTANSKANSSQNPKKSRQDKQGQAKTTASKQEATVQMQD